MNDELLHGVKTYLGMDASPKINLLNALAYLHSWLGPDSWIGFYIYKKEEDILERSLFQGTPACLMIKPSHGVVGTSFANKEDIYVPDVRKFPGYIACDPKSLSESVFYLGDARGHIAIFDIDSPEVDGLKKKNAALQAVCDAFMDHLGDLY
ncbi:MAG: GAF domain-containing protein [Bacilli bacterium]|nr:GAF domain-containing protein [Bacilli bacterium]